MGKYTVETDVMVEIQELHIQFCIANELAEANRLKRLEFKHGVYLLQTHDKLDDRQQNIRDAMNKELEDQA